MTKTLKWSVGRFVTPSISDRKSDFEEALEMIKSRNGNRQLMSGLPAAHMDPQLGMVVKICQHPSLTLEPNAL